MGFNWTALNEELEVHSAKFLSELSVKEAKLDELIATHVADIDKIDAIVNPLYAYVNVDEAEKIIRKYIAYISTFNAAYARERLDVLEDTFGYKSVIVYAAGMIAYTLTGINLGCAYFTSQVLPRAIKADKWKEKVVIFIHETSKCTKLCVDELIDMLNDTPPSAYGYT